MRPPRGKRVHILGQVGCADELEDHVERAMLGKALRRDHIGAQAPRPLARLGTAHGRCDACARGFGELDRGRADATGAAVYEQALAGAQSRLGEERIVGGRERLRQATGRGPVEPAGTGIS